jgi:hypothetical protein
MQQAVFDVLQRVTSQRTELLINHHCEKLKSYMKEQNLASWQSLYKTLANLSIFIEKCYSDFTNHALNWNVSLCDLRTVTVLQYDDLGSVQKMSFLRKFNSGIAICRAEESKWYSHFSSTSRKRNNNSSWNPQIILANCGNACSSSCERKRMEYNPHRGYSISLQYLVIGSQAEAAASTSSNGFNRTKKR